jgi:membrane fusion protein, multidrug efflux system
MKKVGFIIAVFLLAVTFTSCGKKEEPTVSTPPAIQGLELETVRSSSVVDEYEAVGTVRSKITAVLSSKTVGNVQSVHVHEGDRVRTGQLLIEVDDRDTRAQLQKARAGVREAEEVEQEIEQSIRAAESAKDALEAGRSLAIATFNRYKGLLDEKSVSRQEFDEVHAKLQVAEAEVNRAERMLKSLAAKKSQVLARIEQAKADVTGAQVNLGYSRIISPMDGVVTAKQAEIGLLASPGIPLLTLEESSRYRLEASVEDSMIGKIRLGAPVIVSIDALGPEEFSCRVSEIVPASDAGSRSSAVKVDLVDHQGKPIGQPVLRSGFFGRVRFPVGQRQVIRIPQRAVLQSGQLVTVFVVDPSNILRLRLIKTGRQVGDRVEVLSGLNSGDRIVVGGVEKAKEGARVE